MKGIDRNEKKRGGAPVLPMMWVIVLGLLLGNALRAQPLGLENISTAGSPREIVPLPTTAHPELRSRFNKYTKIVAPNGKPIHLLAQAGVKEQQLARARRVMAFYLADFAGSRFGAAKASVANHMADRSATLLYFDDQRSAERALEGSLGDLEFFGQDLYATESPLPGSRDYLDNEPRDATFEEVFHLVQGAGIRPALPQYQRTIEVATEAAWNQGRGGVWTPERAVYNEWASEGSTSFEYIISVIDVYYGYWAYGYRPGFHESFHGEYQVNRREDLARRDSPGLTAVEGFLPPLLDYLEEVAPEFAGVFELNRDSQKSYTHKTQYLTRVQLTGTNDAGINGNSWDNTLTGNGGNNWLAGRGGSDRIIGGEGQDTAAFQGRRDEYRISVTPDGVVTVSDSVANRDGVDRLEGIERLEFRDLTIGVGELDDAMEDSHFEGWRQRHFAQLLGASGNDATLAGEDADPDQDGLSNLLEYITGGNPWEPDHRRRAVRALAHREGWLHVLLERWVNDASIHWALEGTQDFKEWTPLESEVVSESPVPDGFRNIEVRGDMRAFAGAGFARLRVSLR